FIGDEVGQAFNDRHLAAEGVPHRCELNTDDAATEHDRGAGHPVEGEGLVGGDDAAADLKAGQRAGVRPRGKDDVLARVTLTPDLDRVRADKGAVTFDDSDLARLHQAL